MSQGEGQRYAVVIGIDVYADTRIPRLEGAARDAQDIYDLLVDPDIGGFPRENVRLLKNQDATLVNVKTYLGDKLQDLVKRREDTVFIYFSGHGFGEYIITYDSRMDGLIATALRMNQVRDIFRDIQSEKVIFLLDTCFSGHAGGDSPPGVRTLPSVGAVSAAEVDIGLSDIAATGGGRMILTACGVNELAWEEQGHGVFTRCLVEGVRTGAADVNRNGIIDIYDLSAYLQNQVRDDSGQRQNPVSKGTVVRPFPIFRLKDVNERPPIPIIAFFGTQGGVGKTTILNHFVDLLALARPGTKILIVDFDVETMATTKLRTPRAFDCKTMHDYVSTRSAMLESALEVTTSIQARDRATELGESRVYLLPAATDDAEKRFEVAAKIPPDELLEIVSSLIGDATKKYDISCVVVDCEAKVEWPYTAAAAHLATEAFVIGRDETPTWDALKTYTEKIKEFYPDFKSAKAHVILNQLGLLEWHAYEERAEQSGAQIFAAIPDMRQMGDPASESIDIRTVRNILLDNFVFDVVRKTLAQGPRYGDDYSDLDQRAPLSAEWGRVIAEAPQMADSLPVRLYRNSRWPVAIAGAAGVLLGALALAFGGDFLEVEDLPWYLAGSLIAVAIAGTAIRWLVREHVESVAQLVKGKENFVLSSLKTRAGRRALESLRRGSARKVGSTSSRS
jgi:MinD-like ATPase involved in chromosome partitioning or flagellar assembly